jgi:hypothetical protein
VPNQIIRGTMPEQPLHKNCRCIIVPILVGESKERLKGVNYNDWFEKQPNSVKLDILGPSRYAMYKKGKGVTQFVKNDKIMTLKDLGIDRLRRKDIELGKPKKKRAVKPKKETVNPEPVKNEPVKKVLSDLVRWEREPPEILKEKGVLDSAVNTFLRTSKIGMSSERIHTESGQSIRLYFINGDLVDDKGNILIKWNELDKGLRAKWGNSKDWAKPYSVTLIEKLTTDKALNKAELKTLETRITKTLKQLYNKTLYLFNKKTLETDYINTIRGYIKELPPHIQRFIYDSDIPVIIKGNADSNEAYHSAGIVGVGVNVNGVIRLSPVHIIDTSRRVTYIHELGHGFHEYLKRENDKVQEIVLGRLQEIMREEAAKSYKQWAKMAKNTVQTEVYESIVSNSWRGASDLLNAILDKTYFPWGHSKTYWKRAWDSLGNEFTAHGFTEPVAGVGLKEFFPKTYKMFTDIYFKNNYSKYYKELVARYRATHLEPYGTE